MSQHQKKSPTVDPFLDFVCPHCGYGTRRFVRNIPVQESEDQPLRYRPPLFHADMQCEEVLCKVRATVHTIAESDKPTSGPKISVPNWTLDGISCHEGHPVKERPKQKDVLSSRTTNIEE
jgi:hypothetical protein